MCILVFKNIIDFQVTLMNPASILKSLNSSNNLFVDSLRFSIQKIISYGKRNNLFLFFFYQLIPLIRSSRLISSWGQGLSNESTLLIRWPKYWNFSFNISPSNEHPGLISFIYLFFFISKFLLDFYQYTCNEETTFPKSFESTLRLMSVL